MKEKTQSKERTEDHNSNKKKGMPSNLLLLDEDLDLSGFISANMEQESRESEGRSSMDRVKIMDEIKRKKMVK